MLRPKKYLLQHCLTKTHSFLACLIVIKTIRTLFCTGTNCIRNNSGPDYKVPDSPLNYQEKNDFHVKSNLFGFTKKVYLIVLMYCFGIKTFAKAEDNSGKTLFLGDF